MAQFDVYRNPRSETRKLIPYLLELQSDLHAGLDSRLMAPLKVLPSRKVLSSRFEPEFEIEGERVWMATADLASLPRAALREPVTNLLVQRDVILAALDLLIFGI